MGGTWVIGAGLSVIGNLASQLGVNIQKYSFMQNERLQESESKAYMKQPYVSFFFCFVLCLFLGLISNFFLITFLFICRLWKFGFVLVFIGNIADFIALSMAAQTIVAPIASFTLISNVCFAHFWLRETVSWRDILGTLLIIVGATLSVAFGDHTETKFTLEEIEKFWVGRAFLCYIILITVCEIVLFKLITKYTPIKKQLVETISRYENASALNKKNDMEWEDKIIKQLEQQYNKNEKLHSFSLCAFSGIAGAQSVLFGKMVSELIVTSITDENQMFHLLPYVFIVCMFIFVCTQIHFQAIALKFFDALYVVPVFQCFFVCVSTLGGVCFFKELDTFSAVQAAVFPIGLIITLSGVLLLSSRKMNRKIVKHVDECDLANVEISLPTDSSDINLKFELADLEDPKGLYSSLSNV